LQKKILFLIMFLFIFSCNVQTDYIKVQKNGNEKIVAVDTSEKIKLTDLVDEMDITEPENYVYILSGDKNSTINFDEFDKGYYYPPDKSLVFEGIICECSNIYDLNSIIIKESIIITKNEKTLVLTGDLKTFINTYVTFTPEMYAYRLYPEDTIIKYSDLSADGVSKIEIIKPENSIEIKLRGDNPSYLFTEGDVHDILLKISEKPEDYVYFIDDTMYDYDEITNFKPELIEYARKVIYIKGLGFTIKKPIDPTQDIIMSELVKYKENLSYKLVSSDGFSPPVIGWDDFKTGIWKHDEQKTYFSSLNSAKYNLRDVYLIELSDKLDKKGTANDISINDLIDKLEIINYDGQEAVRLSDFIDTPEPESYQYKLIASDGYSPEAFSYEDMQNGYWLLEKEETLFPDNNIGKNRIRDLDRIVMIK